MAKVVAPLLGFSARGQIAKTLVFSSWKGVKYGRSYVVPGNPNTSEQQLTRNTFTWLQNVFKYAGSTFQEIWFEYALGKPMTGYNAFTKFNLPALRTETDLTNFIFSPSTRSGISPKAVSAAGGSGQIAVTVTEPDSIPAGWVISAAYAFAILDQDPQTDTDYPVYENFDGTTPYVPTITGLPAGDYIAGGVFQWQRPDGNPAFSVALTDTATVT